MVPSMSGAGNSSTPMLASSAEKSSKNATKWLWACDMSSTAHISRMECIASCSHTEIFPQTHSAPFAGAYLLTMCKTRQVAHIRKEGVEIIWAVPSLGLLTASRHSLTMILFTRTLSSVIHRWDLRLARQSLCKAKPEPFLHIQAHEVQSSSASAQSEPACAVTCGAPTSTVRQPRPDARIGPIVEPHAMSERTQNSWVGMPRRRATSLHTPNSCYPNYSSP